MKKGILGFSIARRALILVVALLCFVPSTLSAQARLAETKVNIAAGAVAIFNTSVEVGFNRYSAITYDYVGAFAKENYLGTGYAFALSMSNWGYRHYLHPDQHNGLFAGLEFGLQSFRMNKNIVPIVINDHGAGYDVGFGYLFGVNLGYKYPISKHFSVEANISAGWQISLHEGYSVDGVRKFELNPSAEWLAYKGGVYLCYRFW